MTDEQLRIARTIAAARRLAARYKGKDVDSVSLIDMVAARVSRAIDADKATSREFRQEARRP